MRHPSSREMRALTEEETRVMFEKMAKYIGENLQLLVGRPDGAPFQAAQRPGGLRE